MQAIWTRIDGWLTTHFPEAGNCLPPGAAPEALAELERALGAPLPRDLGDFLGVHDGSGDLALHDDGGWFLSAREIASAWKELTEDWEGTPQDEEAAPDGPLRAVWWHRRWIPVAADGMGGYLCIDLDPPDDGELGQVFWWLDTDGPTEVIFPSLRAMMEDFASDLEQGHYSERGLNPAGKPYLQKPD